MITCKKHVVMHGQHGSINICISLCWMVAVKVICIYDKRHLCLLIFHSITTNILKFKILYHANIFFIYYVTIFSFSKYLVFVLKFCGRGCFHFRCDCGFTKTQKLCKYCSYMKDVNKETELKRDRNICN